MSVGVDALTSTVVCVFSSRVAVLKNQNQFLCCTAAAISNVLLHVSLLVIITVQNLKSTSVSAMSPFPNLVKTLLTIFLIASTRTLGWI